MYTAITVFIIIICLLLALVVLVQNSKGGGLASGFSSSNQIMGVRKTTDVLEKLTWGLAISLMVFSITATIMLPRNEDVQGTSVIQEQIDNAAVPSQGMQQPPIGNQPAQQQPAQSQQPAQPAEQPAQQK
jgi:preprotein translocase subunit SecG